jgi:hypothetical protein
MHLTSFRLTLPLLLMLAPLPALAETLANPIGAFSGLDKITGRITNFDVYMGETVQFGALQITPRACYTRPPTETQRTSTFIEVDQVSLKGTIERIFTGWMFADSPALNAIDHPVYDIWLVDCKTTSDTPPPEGWTPPVPPTQEPQLPPATEVPPTEEPPADDLLSPNAEPSAEPLFPEDQTFELPPAQ